jgi:hypothetical protein
LRWAASPALPGAACALFTSIFPISRPQPAAAKTLSAFRSLSNRRIGTVPAPSANDWRDDCLIILEEK